MERMEIHKEGDGNGSYHELPHNKGNRATGGIWRVTGRDGDRAVLKICTPHGEGRWETSEDPRHWNHWRREVLAYETGLTERAFGDAGITGPRLLKAEERADGSYGLWLEDVDGAPGFSWSVPRLGAFARGLGATQARWAGRPLPRDPWLSRSWLREYVAHQDVPARLDWDHPQAAAAWPAELRAGLRRLWEGRDALLAATQAAPRTLSHLDVWPMNLIADGARTVLLDWSFVGDGAVGEDIANLVVDCVTDGRMPAELLPEIHDTVVSGYLAGLRDGGSAVGEDTVRRAVAAAGAAKYSWLAPMMLGRLAAGGPVNSVAYDPDSDAATVLARRVPVFRLILRWVETGRAEPLAE
jgi:hypothetical protein